MVASKYNGIAAPQIEAQVRNLPRRPDIEHVTLDCKNTNTVLPAIDLVNELLEQRVMWVGDRPRGNTTGGAATEHLFVPDLHLPDSGVETSRQTTWTTPQLLAHPEHLNYAAYDRLRHVQLPKDAPDPDPEDHEAETHAELPPAAVAPWILPFDLPLEESRAYFDHLGLSRAQLIDLLRPHDEESVVVERLGISWATYQLLVDQSLPPSSQPFVALDDVEDHTLAGLAWGFYDDLDDLSDARRFLKQTELTVQQASVLFDTWYVGGLASGGDVHAPSQVGISYGEDRCSLTGARFVMNPGAPNEAPLTAAVLSRVHRFLRLQRAAGWTTDELDQALKVCGGASTDVLNEQSLAQLAYVVELRGRFPSVPVIEILAWLGETEWQPSAAGSTPGVRYDGAEPFDRVTLYDKWFLDPSYGDAAVFRLTVAGATAAGVFRSNPDQRLVLTGEQRSFVGAALGLGDAALLAIDEAPHLHPSTLPVTTPAVRLLSTFAQRASLARALKFSIAQLLWLEQRSGIVLSDQDGNFVSAEALVRFVDLADTLKPVLGRDDTRIDYVINDVAPFGSTSFEFDQVKGATWLREIRAGLVEISAAQDFVGFYESAARIEALREQLETAPEPEQAALQAELIARLSEMPDLLETRLTELLSDDRIVRAATDDVHDLPAPGAATQVLFESAFARFWVADDYLAALSDSGEAGTTAQSRALFVLDRLMPYLEVQAREAFVIQTVAARFGLDVGLTELLLREGNREYDTALGAEGTTALAELATVPTVIPAIYLPPPETRTDEDWATWLRVTNSAAHLVFRWLHRVSLLLGQLGVGFEEVAQLVSVRAELGAGDELPAPLAGLPRLARELGLIDLPAWFGRTSDTTVVAERFAQLVKTLRAVKLGREACGSVVGWIEIMRRAQVQIGMPGGAGHVVELDHFHTPIAELTGWDVEELQLLTGTTTASGGDGAMWVVTDSVPAVVLAAVRYEDVVAQDVVERMNRLITASRRAAVPLDKIYGWVGRLPQQPVSSTTVAQVQDLKQYVKSKYSLDDWANVIRPVRDGLREKQRDALVAYLESYGPVRRPGETLYDELLIDPWVSACVLTSRIKAALGSVQLLVQRSTLDLEPQFHVTPQLASQWSWMNRYRVWEANRKVFLYPENWVRPELRTNKTELFRKLESTLLQGEVSEANVEKAYLEYLYALDEISNLEIVGMLREGDGDDEELHVFGRTRDRGGRTFYRRRLGGAGRPWGSWEELPFTTGENGVLPVIHNRRLKLFWLTFEPRKSALTEDDQTLGRKPIDYERVYLAASELKDGEWAPVREYAAPLDGVSATLNSATAALTGYTTLWTQPTKPGDPDVTSAYIGRGVLDGEFTGMDDPANDPLELWSRRPKAEGAPQRKMGTVLPAHRSRLFIDSHVQGSSLVIRLKFTNYSTDRDGDRAPFLYFANWAVGRWTIQGCESDVASQGVRAQIRTSSPRPRDWRVRGQVFESTKSAKAFVLERGSYCHGKAVQFTPVLVSPPRHRVATPQRELGEELERTYIYQDADHAVLFESVDRQNDGDQTRGQILSLHPQVFSHPFTCQMIAQVNAHGLDGLLSPEPESRQDGAPIPVTTGPSGPTVQGSLLRQSLRLSLMSKEAGSVYRASDCVRLTTRYGRPIDELVADIDFSLGGAYSQYNWELFYHIPMLVADRLMQNQRFAEARQWLHRVFDPTAGREDGLAAPQRWWRIKPFGVNEVPSVRDLLESGGSALQEQVAFNRTNPFDPHGLAQFRVGTYMYATVMAYLDNLIAWGDQLFRQETIESINEATLLYLQAAAILGDPPAELPAVEVIQRTYAQLRSGAPFGALYEELENAWLPGLPKAGPRQVMANVPAIAGALRGDVNETVVPVGLVEPTSFALTSDAPASVQRLDRSQAGRGPVPMPLGPDSNPYFCLPPNSRMHGYWRTVDDRLTKIRNCLGLEGQKRAFRLFEPAIDPGALVRAAASGLDLSSAVAQLNAPAPHYRFGTYIGLAKDFVGELRGFGGALLSALEKGDGEELAAMRSGHELRLLERVREVLVRREDEAREAIRALQEARTTTRQRKVFYETRERMSSGEDEQIKNLNRALGFQIASAGASSIAAVLSYIPTLNLGVPPATETGGLHLGAALSNTASALGTYGGIASTIAQRLGTQSSFDRREEDWDFQAEQADGDLKRLEADLEAAQVRLDIAARELVRHDEQARHAREVADFLTDKYTNAELYQWMAGELSRLYFQAYQLAFDVAKRAERCFQRELALSTSDASFIEFGYWDNRRKGLLAGESLGQAVRRMEASYYERNEREYELTKRVSLAEIDPLSLIELRETGTCEFRVAEALFDMDHPSHYLRRIKSVSLSVPAVVGPYTNVNCTLSLQRSAVRVRPDTGDENVVVDLVGGQRSIATSSGDGDAGLFEPNLNDARYLPFETKGVDSHWKLSLPAAFRQFDYASISDVVLTIRYTAREGGELYANKVTGDLAERLGAAGSGAGAREQVPVRLVSARRQFANAWHAFVTANTVVPPTATLDLEVDYGRLGLRARDVEGTSVTVFAVFTAREGFGAPDVEGVQLEHSAGAPESAAGADIGGRSTVTSALADVELPVVDGSTTWRVTAPAAMAVSELEDIALVVVYTPA